MNILATRSCETDRAINGRLSIGVFFLFSIRVGNTREMTATQSQRSYNIVLLFVVINPHIMSDARVFIFIFFFFSTKIMVSILKLSGRE